ncbi:hypothetical protein ACVIGB_000525 [Bradyrhizobium sp. USDA 4341]
MKPEDVAKELQKAWKLAWPDTIKLLNYMEQQPTTPPHSTAEQLQEALSTSRRNMSVLLKGIDDAGVGKRVVGRRGAPTRIMWRYTWKSIAKVARGEGGPEALRPLDSKEAMSRQPRIEHSYVLRHDEDPITLMLPRDLTQREADRLALFIQSLPKE